MAPRILTCSCSMISDYFGSGSESEFLMKRAKITTSPPGHQNDVCVRKEEYSDG